MEYLFVVGGVEEGSNDDGTTHVQVIDMSGKQRVCDRPRRYPFKVSGEMARRSNGNPVICGGSVEFQDEATKLCRMYNPIQDQWDSIAPMKSGRRYFGSVQLNEADFWAVCKCC